MPNHAGGGRAVTSYLVWTCSGCDEIRHARVRGEAGETYGQGESSYLDTCGTCRAETEWVTDGVICDAMEGL